MSFVRRAWRTFYWNAVYPIQHRLRARRLAGRDREKLRLTKVVEPYTLVGFDRLMSAYDLARRAGEKNLEGAIVECGVYKGGSAAMMAMAAPKRTIWLFDSFEGLPEPTADDGEMAFVYANGRGTGALQTIEQCVGPLEVVESLFFDELRIDRARVQVRKGWFQDTLPVARNEIGPIAVLRLDGDWYDSTKVSLDNLYDLVVPGGFVIIDDYNYWEGCRRAVDEFLAARAFDVKLEAVGDSAVWWEVPMLKS